MASTLRLTYNTEGPNAVLAAAYIDDVALEDPISITQQLINGKLQAVITANFTTVTEEDAAPVPAPTLGATYAAAVSPAIGLAVTVTDTAGSGNTFGYVVASSATATPNVGATAPALTAILGTTANVASITANQYIMLYEITASNTVVKFTSHQVTSDEIGVQAPGLTATYTAAEDPAVGTELAITDVAGSGNSFGYVQNTSQSTTPNVGEDAPSLTAVTGSTANVAGAVAGQYLEVYEVTSANKVVKFTSHLLVSGEIGTGA